MSKWYEFRNAHGNHLWLNSERGWMSYLSFHLLANRLDFVLDHAKDVDGITLRQEIGEYTSHTTLAEFELGPQGFGSPDGGILTASASRRCFIFVEAKQASFVKSCNSAIPKSVEELSAPGLDIDQLCNDNKFNSSINGQLELRWRFVNALRASVAAGETVVSERHVPELPQVLTAGDRFYWRLFLRPGHDIKEHWRRVDMTTDLHSLYARLKEVCDDEIRPESQSGFYLLSITSDVSAPDFENRLRLFDMEGNLHSTRRRVFWLNRHEIERTLTPI